MATSTIIKSDNSNQQKEVSLLKRIQTEQNFANQAYANFKSVRVVMARCCF